ncbi:Ger(x)C family spore germination protein [Paenibacillus doosanensis]|uniref:Spore germination protein B3 n=1 Tax=Paenibacillus konkukensis TaxID=2020716 RepID=A0ABY4RFN7_9BACL|nr:MULTISPECIES: Ger(x)C family spore germination protein [Paenibacillus]MCS7461482.1 Ger(x)C family spore germination protein [Paenibacillus doosanensis]UQZ81030.1 Spore germination protein B3 precursor [Paenibacillus konkukensis]
MIKSKFPAYAALWPLLTLFPLLLLTGCWNSIEINDRAFVRMMLLDKSESGIEVTLGFPLPNRLIPGQTGGSGGQTGKPYTFVTKTGRDIGEAYRFIQSDLSRTITFGQTSIIVIGNALAEEGILPVLEFIAREPRFHINASMFVTEGKVKQMTAVPNVFERFPVDILVAYVRQHITVRATVKDALMAAYSGGDLFIPMLDFELKTMTSENNKTQQWMGTDGAAIFKLGKMVGTLNTNEMRGAMWVQETVRDSEITVPSTIDGKDVSFIVKNNQTSIRPVLSGDQIAINIQSRANADLISSESDINFQDAKQRAILEHDLEAFVQDRMSKAIRKSQEAGSDAFQFGQYIDWNYPNKWIALERQWRYLYAKRVKFNIQARIIIKHLGTEKHPLRIRTIKDTGA